MKVAVVGGTGSFGLALARRLVEAGYDVVIGSRDAERAGAAAAEVRAEGASNADAARAADLVVLATKADATLETAEELRDAIGTTPVLSVAAELTFTPGGVLPTPEATSIAARLQERLDGPVIAGLHSLAARNLGADEAPEEDVLVCGDEGRIREDFTITNNRAVQAVPGPAMRFNEVHGVTVSGNVQPLTSGQQATFPNSTDVTYQP